MAITDIAGFVAHLALLDAAVDRAARRAITEAAELVEAEAKASLGNYQDAAGPFPAWSPLADATKADRVRQGYPADKPLLRSGALRDSISHAVTSDRTAIVGSASEYAAPQELGDADLPPRPFLGPAAYRRADEIKELAGGHVVAAIVGGGISAAAALRFKL